MTSGADAVESDLSAGLGVGRDERHADHEPGRVAERHRYPADHSWTASQLRPPCSVRHDLIFLGGPLQRQQHPRRRLLDDAELDRARGLERQPENSIVFSAGCHSGYNIVDSDAVPGVTQTLDWAEAFAQKQATLIAGTGYQYGDTNFLAYSEQLYAELRPRAAARQRARRGRRRAGRGEAELPRRHAEPAGHRHQVAARGDALRPADAQRQHARRRVSATAVDSRIVTRHDAVRHAPGADARPQLGRRHADARRSRPHTDPARGPERQHGSASRRDLPRPARDGVDTSPGAPTLPLATTTSVSAAARSCAASASSAATTPTRRASRR